jgi:endonuclease/exonuclease/phosphatase family metal-dependent hydrolase
MKKLNVLTLSIIIVLMASVHTIAQDLTLMSFNIKYDNTQDTVNNWLDRRAQMVEMVNYYGPDFLGIQEGMHNQVTYLDEGLAKYTFIGVGRDDGKTGGEYSCIFYNQEQFKVVDSNTFWLSDTPDSVSVGWDAALPRVCTYGKFEDVNTGDQFWVFNTHFDHRGKEARNNSAQLIVEKISQLNKTGLPIILMGDFNAIEHEAPIQTITSSLDDALKISQEQLYGPTGTFNGFTDEIVTNRIDYIFTDQVQVVSYAHLDDKLRNNKHLSDHLPVLVEVNISK